MTQQSTPNYPIFYAETQLSEIFLSAPLPADQITATKYPGIIAVDTCVALNRENTRIATNASDDQFGAIHAKALRQFVACYNDRIQEWVRGRGVRGVVLHDHQIRHDNNRREWILNGMVYSICTARENMRRKREFFRFWNRYPKGLPNCNQL